jgi:acetate---CoA ligase (ADP-forming)
VGLSSFVSVGNKSDISGNDLLQYWEQDEGTDVALLYLESVGNPRKFARIAPRVARRMPVLAVKSGRSTAGARATSSHTGAMLSASDITIDALFEQAGVIRAETLHEMFDVAALLSSQPVPGGDRVAIVTNAGGPGILCADALHSAGVEVQELPSEVQAQLAAFLPSTASTANPVDMIATASAEHYRQTLQTLIDADACDAILVIFVPPLVTAAQDVASAVCEVAEGASGVVPIAAVFMTSEGAPAQLKSTRVQIPSYDFPEDAARALAHAARYGRWRARPRGDVPELVDVDCDQAAAIISAALGAGAGWLAPEAVRDLLGCYGLPLVQTCVVSGAAEAAALSAALGGPVALKASARGLVHKTDAGAVALDLDGPDAVLEAAQRIEAAVRGAGYQLDGLVVQPMAPPGVEMIVGVVNDHSFGPVIACGVGGIAAELISDVAVRLTPLTDSDAHDLVRSLRTFPLLDGYRGGPRCDVAAVEAVLLRVSAMVDAHPEIAELDCNPLIASPDGALILDARVRVKAVAPPPPVPSLRA